MRVHREVESVPEAIQVADGNDIDFGGTELTFSPAVPHGPDDELGYVVMTRVSRRDETFVHTSDVLGPPLKAHVAFLLDADPTVLYIDGPMTHMPEEYPDAETRKSVANLLRVIRSTRVQTIIVDHHALRDRDWRAWTAPLTQAAEEHDVRVATAAEFLGKPIDQLEANRDALHGMSREPDQPK